MSARACSILAVASVCLWTHRSLALTIDFLTVGSPGNAGELSGASVPGGYGPDRICGAVDYVFSIGKFEVTAGQYAEFLNAVAADDTYRLYTTNVLNSRGCNIQRSGDSGSYTYSVGPDWADRPVNFVTWGDVARFCNWLTNGQPMGAQDLTTTEDGSYYLNGAMSSAALLAVTRQADARYVMPTEDEWYKAAYYDEPNGVYYDYPTGTDATPGNDLIDPDPGNNANYGGGVIGSPYYRTVVGEFENSGSPYGTFDQGGNLYEWNEAILYGSSRGLRGGSDVTSAAMLSAAYRNSYVDPASADNGIGFRVAYVPEPGTMGLLAFGGGILLGRRRTPGLRRNRT